MTDKTHIGEYISEYFLEGKASVDHPVLKEWLEESAQNRRDFEEYRKIWNKTQRLHQLRQFDTNKAWEKVNDANRRTAVFRKRINRMIYVASGVATTLLVLVLFSLFDTLRPVSGTVFEMSTTYGNQSEIKLPDGSQVQLNAGSHISYRYNSVTGTREVRLSGEGFFEVARNNKSPFVVNLPGNLEIKVLGTIFNVSAYEEDAFIKTSLIEGKIELKVPAERMIMTAGETVSYDRHNNIISYSDKNVTYASGWLSDKIYMEDMPLSEMCKLLERRYDVNIFLQEGIGETIRYNGVLQEESIGDIMEALQMLSRIKYSIRGKNITISER